MRSRFCAALALALSLCVSPALANDISNWSTTDANNNATPPNGWPSGTMLPSQVEPTGRAMMGAIARWYALMGGVNAAGVANTTAVRAATTAQYPNGFFRLTDGAAGAPPIHYAVDTGTCTADDGGSCIAASGGGYFVAQFPGNVADIREFGVVGDNTIDNSVALQNAFTWAAATGGTLYIPNKEFYSATGIAVTIPASGSLWVIGSGQLRFAAAVVNGLTINVTGSNATFHLRDFTVLTSGAPASGSAIKLHQLTASIPDPAETLTSDITNVTVRGADGIGLTDGWTNGIWVDYVSSINIGGFTFSGTGVLAGTAINLSGGANLNQVGVIYNIKDASVVAANIGVLYNSYIQGVTIQHSNFTTVNYGVTSGASNAGTAQLNISNSQIAASKNVITDSVGIPETNIHDNLFYQLNAGVDTNIINESQALGLNINNNHIDGGLITDGHTYNAIVINSGSSTSHGVIAGNLISNVSAGIVLGSTVQGVRIVNNQTHNVTTQYSLPSSPGAYQNSLSQVNPGVTSISQVGATGLTPNWVQLTVATTVGFFNDEWVCVMGTTASGDPDANTCTTISITDGTHMVLQFITADGNLYSSAGTVSAIP